MRKLIIVLMIALAAGCAGKKTAPAPEAVPFPSPKVPSMITDQDEALEWVAGHFWDKFLDTTRHYLCDSTHIGGTVTDEVEYQVGVYSTLLQEVRRSVAMKSVASLYDKLEACEKADTASNIFDRLVPILSRYLYDPNSPVRDEDLYYQLVSRLADSPFAGDMATSYAFETRMCALNPIGSPAADFRFRDLAGRTRTLYSVKARHTLLFFSNPGCPNCQEIIEYIKANFSDRVADGSLAVVCVYIDDDIPAWKDYAPSYPREWYCGYDPDGVIRDNLVYCVRAIPSLYLLDEDKTVILKDAPEQRVYEYLGRL